MDYIELAKEIGETPFRVGMLIALTYGVRQLSHMKDSMNKLHTAIAVVVEKVSSHEKRITTLERKKK